MNVPARLAVAVSALLGLVAFLRIAVALAPVTSSPLFVGVSASLLFVSPSVLFPLARLLRRRLARIPRAAAFASLLPAAQLLFALGLSGETGALWTAVLLGVTQANLFAFRHRPVPAVACAVITPLACLTGIALVPAPSWIIQLGLALLATGSAAAWIQLEAARTRAGVQRATTRAGRFAFVTLALSLVVLVLLPPAYWAVVSLPTPLVEIVTGGRRAGGPLDSGAIAVETGSERRDESFTRFFPNEVKGGGTVTRYREERVMEVRALDPRGGNAGDVGPLYMRAVALEVLTETGVQRAASPRSRILADATDEQPGDGWTTIDGPPTEAGSLILDVALQETRAGDEAILFAPERRAAISLASVRIGHGEVLALDEAPEDDRWLRYRVRIGEVRGGIVFAGLGEADRSNPRLLDLPPRGAELDGIVTLARELTGGADSDRERVRRVLDHLATFEYSLSERDFPGLAGIVRFLERRSGHCTRFATAATFLLRAAGVPARVATGFLASTWDADEERYVVTTDRGHAWIEVPFRLEGRTEWITFDPTPGESLEAALSAARRLPQDGLASWLGQVAHDLTRFAASGGDAFFLEDLVTTMGEAPQALLSTVRRYPLESGILFGVLALLLARRRIRGRRRAGEPVRGSDSRLESTYAALLHALSRLGYRKAPAQTPLEFAIEVQSRGGEALNPVRAVIELVYRERFGGIAPTPAELASIDAFLRHLRST